MANRMMFKAMRRYRNLLVESKGMLLPVTQVRRGRATALPL